ncbi:hypothetical protein F5Y09DRAFT_108226 [Xylaria sp. FL1042]|nr:hypothetical protein F5Y09DRAFT_108226 [Xylaria sp. FL1042]
MHRNAMRWLGQLKWPPRGLESFPSHSNGRAVFNRIYIYPKQGDLQWQVLPLSRAFYSSSKLQTEATPSSSRPAPSAHPQSSNIPKSHNSQPHGTRWIPLVVIFAASAGAAYLYRRLSASLDDDVINTSTFTAFTITEREQVSPTAFIITLRPSAWVNLEELDSGRIGWDDGLTGFLSSRIQEAWRHGLWAVEIKQPQLQIARHYTPLPPLSPSTIDKGTLENGDQNKVQADLRILIRRMDGGEMSNYLSRQRVGDTVWLRGPHLGFDVSRRLGGDSSHESGTEIDDVGGQKGVVFLAGGTGIAPALQIARKLLDGNGYSERRESRPHISILWANRWGADALGREELPSTQKSSGSWFRFWSGGADPSADQQEKQKQPSKKGASSLALQIQDLKQRYPSHFDISYFVDNEGSFIEARHVKAALASTTPSSSSSIDRSCTWHSQKAVELLPDDNDATRSSSPESPCTCIQTTPAQAEPSKPSPGVSIICVSGPDGFIEAYAGAKRWHDGKEMQGTIRGLLGRIQNEKGDKVSDWLVLKL